MNEILEIYDREVSWFYLSLLGNKPGFPITQKHMGFDNYSLNQALTRANNITHETWEATVIARASEITTLIGKGRFFPNHNIEVAKAAGLRMLEKNGFTIKSGTPMLKVFSRKKIEDWFRLITIPPTDK